MRIGYAYLENPALEGKARGALVEASCDEVLVDAADIGRDAFWRLMGELAKGDSLVVATLADLAPSIPEVMEAVGMVGSLGADIVALSEGIDTSAQGRAFFGHVAAIEGAAEAKAAARPHPGGRPKEVDQARIDEAIAMQESGDFKVSEILEATGLSKSTFYRYVPRKGSGDT